MICYHTTNSVITGGEEIYGIFNRIPLADITIDMRPNSSS